MGVTQGHEARRDFDILLVGSTGEEAWQRMQVLKPRDGGEALEDV